MTSPYAYAFEPQYPKIPWPKLELFEPLSKLHARYWGNPIQGDEPEHPTPSEGQPIGDDEDQPMGDDEDQSEVGPGCFALNLGIQSLRTQRLWVRKDYIRFYDHCVTRYNRGWNRPNPDTARRAPSVVITGQPGIGRCFSSLRPFTLKHPFMNREKLLDLLCRPPTTRRK